MLAGAGCAIILLGESIATPARTTAASTLPVMPCFNLC
jgi:hypothetical protein